VKQIALRLLLVVVGIMFGLGVIEVGLHLFPGLLPPAVRQALAIYNDSHQTQDLYRPFTASDELIYVPRPDVDIEIHNGLTLSYTVRTRRLGTPSANSPAIGFRDIGPTSPVYAVAVGDSMTWGTYVEAGQTWPEQLEAAVGAPVLNMGVLGYGPIQYRILTEKYGLPLHPRLVLWGLFTGNDFTDSTYYANWEKAGKTYTGLEEPETGLRDFLSRHLRLYELFKFVLRLGIYSQRGATEQAVVVPAPGGPDWTFYPDVLERLADGRQPDVAEGWDLTQQAILDAQAGARSAGSRLVIIAMPSKELIYQNLWQGRVSDPSAYDLGEPVRTLMAFCEAKSLPCLDLTPPLSAHAASGEELFLRQDAHLNPAGHRLVAQLVKDYLTQQGLLP
jgi:acetyltransferase AlgX (SGNH hydrolase-like protein)